MKFSTNTPDILHTKMLSVHDKDWIDYISSKQGATIFHHPSWLENLSRSYGYKSHIITVQSSEGNILAGLPIMEVQNTFSGSKWISLPFSDYCNPLYENQESLEVLTKSLIDLSQMNNPAVPVELRWEFPPHPEMNPFANHVLHKIPISRNIDAVHRNFSKNTRRCIKEAENEKGLSLVWGNTLDHMRLFYSHQTKTRHRHGMPVQPWKYFKLLQEHVIQNGLGAILLTYYGNTCIAGLIILYFQKTLTFKYPASDESYHNYHPNHYTYWNAIKWASENGFETIDWGRSEASDSDIGLRTFKSKWGAVETPLVYTNIASPVSGLTTSKSMQIMNSIIRKSPLFVSRIIGEMIYQYFP